MGRATLVVPAALAALVAASRPAAAQHAGADHLELRLQAVPVYTAVEGAPGGGSDAELRVVQPVAMLHGAVAGGRLRFAAAADFEGLTMPGGELAPGAWGEGFVDRRHPHTYVHELTASLVQPLGAARVSLTAGKGFAPFGTDDPMTRPPLRYPVNHHLAQILERLVAIAAVRAGPVGLEAGLFDGDEPERPGQWPAIGRFGDSWSARLTVAPLAGLELQGSHARVHSPEHRPGAGPAVRKWSVAARWERPVAGHPVEALAEWARSSEAGGVFRFGSLLAESAWRAGPHRLYYRFERTERPEEQRLLDPYRSTRPHLDNSILATTRWTIHTLGYTFDVGVPVARLRVEPLAEVSAAAVHSLAPAAFDPAAFYGRGRLWSFSVGARIAWGAMPHRMGRYGVMTDAMPPMAAGHPTEPDSGEAP